MSNLVQFDIEESEDAILIDFEEEELPDGQFEIGGETPNVVGKSKKKFVEAIGMINTVSSNVFEKIKNSTHRPDEVTVDFGVKFDAAAGAFLAKAGAGTHLNIKLTWKKPPTDK